MSEQMPERIWGDRSVAGASTSRHGIWTENMRGCTTEYVRADLYKFPPKEYWEWHKEEQLAAAQAKRDEFQKKMHAAVDNCSEACGQRDRLAEALREIAEPKRKQGFVDQRNIASAALALEESTDD